MVEYFLQIELFNDPDLFGVFAQLGEYAACSFRVKEGNT